MALIYNKDEGEVEDVNENVKNSIDPVSLQIGVKRMKRISRDGLLTVIISKTEFNKLEIKMNEKLNEKVQMKKAES